MLITRRSGLVPVGSGWGVRERLEAWMAEETGLTCCESGSVSLVPSQGRMFRPENRASRRAEHTSFSPTKTCTVRPFGTTCATSLNRTFDPLFLSGCTRKFSNTSGLNLPPARSLERSSFRRSTAAAMSASSAEKSFGSSAGAASFWEEACALDSSRAALPPFLRREGVVEKGRWLGRMHCWGCWVRVVVRLEACLECMWLARWSCYHGRGGSVKIPGSITSELGGIACSCYALE